MVVGIAGGVVAVGRAGGALEAGVRGPEVRARAELVARRVLAALGVHALERAVRLLDGLCEDESEMRGVKTRIRYAFHASREVNTPHSSARPPEEKLEQVPGTWEESDEGRGL